ncbi:hypothetical protein G6O67_007167 [Ophiocordyceps sinensis]|uniref:Uncharacterized protein n=1 Tax=Ophiocordyceps sinensis TaxID=72228 RepID=A0A8H4PIF9_9HYPO|nr:hypothetical protein G6O67_007167 [Ophiocordyceps sinensis]
MDYQPLEGQRTGSIVFAVPTEELGARCRKQGLCISGIQASVEAYKAFTIRTQWYRCLASVTTLGPAGSRFESFRYIRALKDTDPISAPGHAHQMVAIQALGWLDSIKIFGSYHKHADIASWETDVTHDNTDEKAVTTHVARFIITNASSSIHGYELFNDFQDHFDGWTEATWNRAHKEYRKALKTFLRNRGIWTGPKNYSYATSFLMLQRQEIPPIWPKDELTLGWSSFHDDRTIPWLYQEARGLDQVGKPEDVKALTEDLSLVFSANFTRAQSEADFNALSMKNTTWPDFYSKFTQLQAHLSFDDTARVAYLHSKVSIDLANAAALQPERCEESSQPRFGERFTSPLYFSTIARQNTASGNPPTRS